MDQNRFAEMTFPKNPPGPFQNDELAIGIGMLLEQDGRPSDGRGDGGGIDLGAASILRHTQEHGAAAQVQIAGPFVETEDGVGPEAGEGSVGKG
jgi:hypothetical protein